MATISGAQWRGRVNPIYPSVWTNIPASSEEDSGHITKRTPNVSGMEIKGNMNISSADANYISSGSSRYYVDVFLSPVGGSSLGGARSMYRSSQWRRSAGTTAWSVRLDPLPPGGKFKVLIRIGVIPSPYVNVTATTYNRDPASRGFTFVTNRRPSKPTITLPATGTSVSFNDGDDSILPFEWESTDEDEITPQGTTSYVGRWKDRGGWQIQMRSAPTIENPDSQWIDAMGVWSDLIRMFSSKMMAHRDFPMPETIGDLQMPQQQSPNSHWEFDQTKLYAGNDSNFIRSKSARDPHMLILPGTWQFRVRVFDYGIKDGYTTPSRMDPSNVSEWSDPITLYVVAPFLPPTLISPIYDQAAYVNDLTFAWQFRDPRPAGGDQASRRIRIRPTEIPAGTTTITNLLRNPKADAGIDAADVGWVAGPNTTVSRFSPPSTPPVASSMLNRIYTSVSPPPPGTVAEWNDIGSPANSRVAVTPGWVYTASAYVHTSGLSGPVPKDVQLGLEWFDSSGTSLGVEWLPYYRLSTELWERLYLTRTAPPSAATARLRIRTRTVQDSDYWLVFVDAVMLNRGTLFDYFDGATNGGEWSGTPDNSTSTKEFSNDDLAWREVIDPVDRPGDEEEFFWEDSEDWLVAGERYEWQARTISTPGDFDSGWSGSGFFWAIAPADSGPVVPDDITVPSPGLGCGTHKVVIATRGGIEQVGTLDGIVQVRWDRVRDDISSATVQVEAGKGCDDLLRMLRTWQYEIIIYRDNGDGRPQRVWEGPITRLSWERDQVEIAARDPMIYVYRRILRQGFNDSYRVKGRKYGPNPSNPSGPGIIINPGKVISQPLSVVTRSARIIQNALAYDDPNVLRYMRVLSRSDDAKQSRVYADYSATAWQVVDDFAARAGLDYTTVGRSIILWDTHRGIGRLPEMVDGDFDSDPIVTEYGMQAANYYGVTNGSGVYGTASRLDDDGRPLYYGWLEMLNSAYGEDDSSGSEDTLTQQAREELEAAFTDQARRNIQDRMPAPVVVRVPDNSTLSPDLNIDINHLVPGVYIPLRATSTLREIVQVQKLDKVAVVESAESGEQIKVTMSPSHADDAEAAGEAEA